MHIDPSYKNNLIFSAPVDFQADAQGRLVTIGKKHEYFQTGNENHATNLNI